MGKYRAVVASTRRKLKTFLDNNEDAPEGAVLAEAKKFADDYKLEHGVNVIVTQIVDVYTTTTLDEAVAEQRAADEARARNPNAAA